MAPLAPNTAPVRSCVTGAKGPFPYGPHADRGLTGSIEYIILVPFLCGLYVAYFNLSFEEDSAAQAPEKLYRERGLMSYVALLIVLFAILTMLRIPVLSVLMDTLLLKV